MPTFSIPFDSKFASKENMTSLCMNSRIKIYEELYRLLYNRTFNNKSPMRLSRVSWYTGMRLQAMGVWINPCFNVQWWNMKLCRRCNMIPYQPMAALIYSGDSVKVENSQAADHKYIIKRRHNLEMSEWACVHTNSYLPFVQFYRGK